MTGDPTPETPTNGEQMTATDAVRVSSADLTPLQIAEAQAGCLGRWICEDSLGFVEFGSQEEADATLIAASWDDRAFAEVSVAQADAVFRHAERVGVTAEDRAMLERIKARIIP
jgi:hypothetical protein